MKVKAFALAGFTLLLVGYLVADFNGREGALMPDSSSDEPASSKELESLSESVLGKTRRLNPSANVVDTGNRGSDKFVGRVVSVHGV